MEENLLLLDKQPNILDYISFTDRDIEKTVSEFKFTASDIKDEEVEERIRFHIFVHSFNIFLRDEKTIPNPEEFFSYYVQSNQVFFSDKVSNKRIMEGLKARVFRAYPSYIRDLHFAVLCKSDLQDSFPKGFVKSFKVVTNYNLDAECGIDMLIEVNGRLFGVNLYTKTKRALDARGKKEHRHIPFSNVEPIEFPLDMDNCSKHGDIFLYNFMHIVHLKKIIYAMLKY